MPNNKRQLTDRPGEIYLSKEWDSLSIHFDVPLIAWGIFPKIQLFLLANQRGFVHICILKLDLICRVL